MADLLINGMEMPKNCAECDDDMIRMIAGCNLWNNGDAARHTDCPLVEVPTHGELIDRDKLLVLMSDEIIQRGGDERSLGIAWAQSAVEVAPTVIEASEGGEDKAGEWINLGHRPGILKHPYSVDYKCPFCDYEQYTMMFLPPKKCPRCGARLMVECKEGETDGKL